MNDDEDELGASVARVGLIDFGALVAELALVLTLLAVGLLARGPLQLHLALAVTFPAALVVVWGYWLAPRARRRLGRRGRIALKVSLTVAVGATLAAAGPVLLAAVLAVIEIALLVAGEARASTTGTSVT